MVSKDKASGLLGLVVSDKGKKFYNLATRIKHRGIRRGVGGIFFDDLVPMLQNFLRP
jgi:coproporphyrinogen III oxidase